MTDKRQDQLADVAELRRRIAAIEAGEPEAGSSGVREKPARRTGLRRGAPLRRKTPLRTKTLLRNRPEPK